MFTKSTVSQSMIDAVNSILEEEKKQQQLDEASAFDWKANKNETDPKFTTKKPGERTGHESKKTATGTVYTKKPLRSDGQEFKKEEIEISFKDRLLALKNAQRHIQNESKTFDELLEDLNDGQVDKLIFEVLGKDADAGDYIHDFIHSKNSKFAGKSKEMRKKMALGAYYGKHNESVDVTDYNPKSQGGTRKELLAKYSKSGDPKHAEAARKAGATQSELKSARGLDSMFGHRGGVDKLGIKKEEVKDEYARKVDKYLKKKYNKEEVEELDELSKGTLNSYMDKAKDRYVKHASSTSTSDHVANVKSVKYAKNMLKAKEKGGKFSEDVELDEANKANKESKKDFDARQARLAAASKASVEDPLRLKRLSSIPGYTAAMDLAKKTTKEELIGGQKKIDKNHNGKIDAQDFQILRGQKTEAVEPTAVTTDTLAGPVKGGKPNQHSSIKVKLKSEAVNEVMDEPKYSLSIQARQKKADDANKPPFDGPYTKAKGNIKDKSGAIHTPMSRARDLAKNAMKKVKTEMLGKTGTSEWVNLTH